MGMSPNEGQRRLQGISARSASHMSSISSANCSIPYSLPQDLQRSFTRRQVRPRASDAPHLGQSGVKSDMVRSIGGSAAYGRNDHRCGGGRLDPACFFDSGGCIKGAISHIDTGRTRQAIFLEAISKKSFCPISALSPDAIPRHTAVCLRIASRSRLDLEQKS